MKKIAWIGHFIKDTDKQLFLNTNLSGKDTTNPSEPYVFADLVNEKKGVELVGIICPVTTKEIVSSNKIELSQVLSKAIDICNSLKVDQIGIAALFASMWEDGAGIREMTKHPITTGKNLIMAFVFDYINKICDKFSFIQKDLTIGLVGNGGRMQEILVEHFINKAEKILVTKDSNVENDANVDIVDNHGIFASSDVIINTTMGIGLEKYIKTIRKNAIFCDLIVPFLLSRKIKETRKDVFPFEGVWAQYVGLDNYTNILGDKNRLFPMSIFPACVAEIMILAYENNFSEYSLGANINYKNSLLMAEMYSKHDFQLSFFKQGKEIIQDEALKLFNSKK